MGQAVVSLLTVGVMIYALVDCWRSLPTEVHRLSRAGWVVVILVLPLVGAVAYLVLGRAAASSLTGGFGRSKVLAPDDDPEFLQSLDVKRRQHAAEERRRHDAEERRRKSEQRAEQKAEKAEQRAEQKAEKAEQKAERKAERKPDRAPVTPVRPTADGEPGDAADPVRDDPDGDDPTA